MFDDLLEHTDLLQIQNLILHLQIQFHQILQILFERFQSQKGHLGQAAVYGLGMCAIKLRDDFEKVLGVIPVVTALINFINVEQQISPPDETKWMWDNAVGALGRILKSFPNLENMNTILPSFLENIPLAHDTDENVPQFEIFCELWARDDFPPLFRHHPKLEFIFQEILSLNCSHQTQQIATEALATLQNQHIPKKAQ